MQSRKYPNPLRPILIIAVSTFTIESAIMGLETLWPGRLSPLAYGALDAIGLTVLLLPVLYFFVYRPTEAFLVERQTFISKISRLDQLHLVGKMVVSMAHEIRNPMTTVRGFLQILSEKEDCGKYSEQFALMIDELDRANSMLVQFLSLSREKRLDLKKLNLNSIIQHLIPLIRTDALLREQKITTELGKIPDLLLDEREISQLILNLTRNGLEAMSAGQTLMIRTCLKAEKVVLEVLDQGPGIEADVLDKIGIPFFTTKKDGNGLGMAVCFSIAERHKASIKINSGPSGTVIAVTFGH